MNEIVVLALAIIQVAVLVVYWRHIPKFTFFLLPATYFVANIYSNYTMRAIYLTFFDIYYMGRYPLSLIISSMLYVSFFLIIYMVTFILTTRSVLGSGVFASNALSINLSRSYQNQYSQVSLHICFVLYFISFIYRVMTGRIFALGLDPLTDAASLAERGLLLIGGTFPWFIIPYCAILMAEKFRPIIIMELLFTVGSVLFVSVASATKGLLPYLFCAYFFCNAIRGKKLRILALVLFLAIGVGYSIFSYLLRQYGTVSGEFSFELVFDNLLRATEASQDPNKFREVGVISSLERLAYLDPLIYMMQGNIPVPAAQSDFWVLGSLAEMGNLIPRFIWPSRPFLDFNKFVTYGVWGIPGLMSSTPIGRLGESYYVLEYFGLLYAVAYGLIHAWVVFIFAKYLNNPFAISLYFWILITYIFPDAHFVNGFVSLMWVGFMLGGLYFIERYVLGRSVLVGISVVQPGSSGVNRVFSTRL